MAWLAATLESQPKAASKFSFEVSEFAALRNEAALLKIRDLARRFGGTFGIDHFGLDPQAVQLLRAIAPDYVKLSGILASELIAQPNGNELLSSFVKLAHSLDVLVIAQQVESTDQVAELAAAGVDGAQGYYFGAPQ